MRLALLALLAISAFGQNNPVTALYPTSVDDTQLGVFTDRAYSTLADVLGSTDSTLTVEDASAFPNAEFWVVVCPLNQCGIGASAANGETIFITGKSGDVLTIGATGRQVQADQTGTSTGGANPTHGIGEAVVLAPAAGQLNRFSAELNALHAAVGAVSSGSASSNYGPYSDLSSVTGMSAGDVYRFDGSEDTLYTHAIYSGSEWVPYYKGYKCDPPVLGDFTWDNQGSATATTVGGSIYLTMPNASNGPLRALYKSAPSTPYTIEILVFVHYIGGGDLDFSSGSKGAELALLFRESSTARLLSVGRLRKTYYYRRWTTSSNQLAGDTPGQAYWGQAGGPYWLRISDDGTDRIFWASVDGKRFTALISASTDYNTWLTPDQVGFGAVEAVYANSMPASYSFLSWKEL